jgi:Lectin C-type domain
MGAHRTKRSSALHGLALLLTAACSAPDGSDLFLPRGSGGSGAAAQTSGGTGGTEPDASASLGGTSNGEGQGGSEVLGVGGASAGSNNAGASAGGTSAESDAGLLDAASPNDAQPPPCAPGAEICDGLDNDCDDDVDPGSTCATECAGFAIGGRGYMYCADAVTRAQALPRCEAEGMHLVWLETQGESAAVRARIASSGFPAPNGNAEILTQIGGSDAAEEGTWSWVGSGAIAGGVQFWQGDSEDDGGAAVQNAYAEWSDGEPSSMMNEDCAAMSVLGNAMRAAGEWDDRSCNEQLPFACEVP